MPQNEATPVDAPARWLMALGACQVVVGGLVAAATSPLDISRGSWLAAYLVLVGGVAQHVMGKTPLWFHHRLNGQAGWAHVIGWNLGNLAVIGGVYAATPLVVDAGGVVLMAVLVIAAIAVLRPKNSERRAARWTYVGMLVALAISIPIGLTLAHLRA